MVRVCFDAVVLEDTEASNYVKVHQPGRDFGLPHDDVVTVHCEKVTLLGQAEDYPGRLARMEESTRFPSCCVRHRRRVKWVPAPGWWIHDDSLSGPCHTCTALWDARAPSGATDQPV